MIRFPSGVQSGNPYDCIESRGVGVRGTGSPPSTDTFHNCPPTRSAKVPNAIHFPSGEKLGENSRVESASARDVRRRGFLPSYAMYSLPAAANANRLVSGERRGSTI